MTSSGFWSYVQADNEAEQGRIKDLADDLGKQFAAITSEPIQIFFDKSSLGWGDDWEARIEDAVIATSFFVPIVSPRYLASDACRRELQLFVRKAESIGYKDLVLPLVWFDVPDLHEANPVDDLAVIIKRYHWADWRDLRFEERDSGVYRRAVADLAQRLVNINARTAVAGSDMVTIAVGAPTGDALAVAEPDTGDDDATLGTLDVMALAETAMPAWADTMRKVRAEIEAVGALTEEATVEMRRGEKQGKGFAARLTAARVLAQKLEPYAQRIEELGNEFTTHLYDIDGGIRAMLAQVQMATEDSEREVGEQLKESVHSMATSSREGLGAMRGMVESIAPIEAMSRDLRAPLRKIRKGLTVMVEGQRVIEEWDRLAGSREEGPDNASLEVAT
jgi:TIR domain